jgi:hypothetical protein
MPSVVKGTHAFRPSQQTVGAIANAPYPGTSVSAMQPPQTSSLTHSGLEELDSSGDDGAQPPPTLHNVPSSVISVSTHTSSTKRKYSAVGDSGDGSVKSSAVVSTGSKKQRAVTGAVALNGIKDALEAFNVTIRTGLSQTTKPSGAEDPNMLKASAITRVQEEEGHLDVDRVVALVDLFQLNTSAAVTYMALGRKDVRQAWIEKKLVELGFPQQERG